MSPGKLTHLHSVTNNVDLWTFRPGEAITETVFDIIRDTIEDEFSCQSGPPTCLKMANVKSSSFSETPSVHTWPDRHGVEAPPSSLFRAAP